MNDYYYYFLEFSKDEKYIRLMRDRWEDEECFVKSINDYNDLYTKHDKYYIQVSDRCANNILTASGIKRISEQSSIDCNNVGYCKIPISGLYKMFCKINGK